MSTPSVTAATAAAPAPDRPAAPQAGGSRLAWVDGLRIVLTVLVVAHHAALTYSTIPLWYWLQPGSDPSAVGLTIFVALNQLWFMGAFFLLSGLFVPGSYDRKGGGRFTVDRLVRLGIPLVIFVVLLRPLLMLPSALAERAAAIAGGRPFSMLGAVLLGGDPGPTWFLEVLLVFSLVYAAIRLVRPGRSDSESPAATRPSTPRPLPAWAPAVVVAAMALVTVLWRMVVPDGTYWPIVGLPSPAFLPQYAILFVAGVVAARTGWLTHLRTRLVWPAAASSAVGLLLVFGSGGSATALTAIGSAVGGAMLAVGNVVLAVIICQRVFAAEPGRLRRFLSAQAFAVYLIHPVVLVAWAAVLSPLPVPSAVHAVILLVLSLPTSWLLAAAVRRIPGVRRVL